MSELPHPLVSGELARLIPVVKDSMLEDRATSILLATFRAVPGFTKVMLGSIGQRVGVQSKIECYSQIGCVEPKGGMLRPDGFIRIARGKKVWSAIVEAKIGSAPIDREQLVHYTDLAKRNEVDAVITISNEFASVPSHHPVSLKPSERRGVEIYHWSWLFAVTQGLLIKQSGEEMDQTQKFVLDEFLRYFEHESVGVKGFNRMNSEWKSVVQSINNRAVLKKNSEEVANTVSAWHQECRDLCLIMSRELGVGVKERMPQKHVKDPTLRRKDGADRLIKDLELSCVLDVPDAAAPIEITVSLIRRSIAVSMKLNAPTDKRSGKPQINWFLKQLAKSKHQSIFVRACLKNTKLPSPFALELVRDDPTVLNIEGKEKNLFSWFEVSYERDLAGRFSGSQVFIQNLEEMVPHFYEEVGRHLRAWVAPPPRAQKTDVQMASDQSAQTVPAELT